VSYAVDLTAEAQEDLQRVEDFLIETALAHGDLDLPRRAMVAIRAAMHILEINPFTCRIADQNPYERELTIPFGGAGYVALFEIVSERQVIVTALRHQREDDFH
jgi:hypothetical protein